MLFGPLHLDTFLRFSGLTEQGFSYTLGTELNAPLPAEEKSLALQETCVYDIV